MAKWAQQDVPEGKWQALLRGAEIEGHMSDTRALLREIRDLLRDRPPERGDEVLDIEATIAHVLRQPNDLIYGTKESVVERLREIARLRAEVERITADRQALSRKNVALRRDIDGLHEARNEGVKKVERLTRERDEAQAHVERVDEAVQRERLVAAEAIGRADDYHAQMKLVEAERDRLRKALLAFPCVPDPKYLAGACWGAICDWYNDRRLPALADAPEPDENTVYAEIRAERARQDSRWGGPEHDNQHGPNDWCRLIRERNHYDFAPGEEPRFRRRMIVLAALAVAGIETYDRMYRHPAPAPDEPAGEGGDDE